MCILFTSLGNIYFYIIEEEIAAKKKPAKAGFLK